MIRISISIVVAMASLGVTVSAQEDLRNLERTVYRLQDELVAERAKMLQNIKVNGQPLDPDAVMREAVYLTGGKLVEAKVADFFILEEVQRQVEEGGRMASEFQVTEEDVLIDLEPKIAEFRVKYPGIDFWDAVRTQYGLSKETYMQQRRQAIVFDRVFFPGSPQDWPQITKEAIMARTQDGQGSQFLEQLEEAGGPGEDGKPRQLPEFWIQMMRQFVQQALRNWSDIKYASHGLPSEVVLSVNDKEWSTEDAFEYVRKGLYVQDLERAMQEVIMREALKQELIKAGAYVDDDTFRDRYEEYREPYDSTPFTVEVIATKFKGYPCLEAFRARWRLITSYGDMIADEFTNEHLQAHADKYAAFFGDGNVNLDVIPFLARDPMTAGWVPDGMDKAKERAEEVFALLENKEMTFDQAMAERAEFFMNDEKKGRLGFLPLNQVKQQFRETEFTQMLDGYSVASYLFYDAPIGKTVGPIKGPDGYYIVRINARTPARKRMDVTNERENTLVREDYLNHRFMEWANEVIAKTEIE
ncbi:MAG: hypothetical protein VYE77_04070 [Planctomycetota bacterium]|nr:hypothetical protein [Planctomycetota bacterium]